jgi:hypothetical protein
MAYVRFRDWPKRLAAQIEISNARRFAYGQQDCGLFPADCILAMTGVDLAAELRGYDSKIAAYRIIARHGSLEALATALVGSDPVHPSRAHRGDLVLGFPPLADGETGESLGLCLGPYCAYPKGVGLQMRPRSDARLAWRIG